MKDEGCRAGAPMTSRESNPHSSFILHPSSFSACRLIIDPPAPGAWNMAADQWLLHQAAASGACSLRLYHWSEPTLSLGYFQRYGDRSQDPRLSGVAVVRRISGGGAILHDRELTYCLAVPAAHPLSGRRQALYQAAHGSIVEALGELEIAASLCTERPSVGGPEPFLCFQRRSRGDVLVGQAKVAGSAQRRIQGAVMQHGSLLLARSAIVPELPGLCDLAGSPVSEERMIDHWLKKLAAALRATWRPEPLSDGERSEVASLVEAKYGSQRWTEDRRRASRGDLL